MGTTATRLHPAAPFLWIAALTVLAYAAALNNGYVWDDHFFVGDTLWVGDIRAALESAFSPLFGQRAYVRPIPLLMLHLEAMAFNRSPAVPHAVNIALHIATTSLVYLLARRAATKSGQSPTDAAAWIPILLAGWFAVHPALSETIIWVSSRFDLLATLFMLLALWVAGLNLSDWRRAFAVGALFFIAALCKESAAVLPMALGVQALLLATAQRNDNRINLRDAFTARELKCYAVIIGAGLVYLVIRHYVLTGAELMDLRAPSPQERLARIVASLWKYVQLTAVPFVGNSPHHAFEWSPNATLAHYALQISFSVALLLGIAILAFKRLPAGWWLLVWLAAYLPVLHLVPLPIGGNLVHQRFMYYPTAVLLIFAPYVLAKIRLTDLGQKAAIFISVIVIALSVLVARSIVPVWANDLALWRWTTNMAPDSVEARENLLWSYLELNMFDEADREFEYIVKHGMRTSPNVAVNMGAARHRQGRFKEALHFYEIAYPKADVLPKAQQSNLASNMAHVHTILGNDKEAWTYLQRALDLNPRNQTALGLLLAVCDGREAELARFDPIDLERAIPSATEAKALLQAYQSEKQSTRALCRP